MRRLARCYGTRYEYFCWRALGIPIAEDQTRRFQEPAPELLRKLSVGTGVPVEQLAQMTLRLVYARLQEELNRYAATPEGKAELERLSNQWLSQKS